MNINQKGFAPIIIVLAILVLAGVGGAGYYLINKQLPKQTACTEEAKICPDGSSVGRIAPDCEFAACPEAQPDETFCTMDVKLCPDGSSVGRIAPDCEFAACPEVKVDETADWKTYTNQDLGVSFDYPTKIAGGIIYTKKTTPSFDGCELRTPSNLTFLVDSCVSSMVDFFYYYLQPPFVEHISSGSSVCSGHFLVNVMEKPSSFSIEKIKENLKMGEYITIDKEKAVRRYEFIPMPPGGGGDEDVVYIIKDEKLYVISFLLDREVIGDDNFQKCLQSQTSVFNHILSTFKFISPSSN